MARDPDLPSLGPEHLPPEIPSQGAEHLPPQIPSELELARMSREELVRLASAMQGVEVVADVSKWPKAGTRREKRAERITALCFTLSALFAIAFVLAYSLWPNEYVDPFTNGHRLYSAYTPVIGCTFGLAVLSLGVGLIFYLKKFFPEEVSVQHFHTGHSEELDRKTAAARFEEAGEDTGFGRRTLVKRALLGAVGLFGVTAGVLAVGGFVRNPWRGGSQAALWVTGWKPLHGETVYLRAESGVLGQIVRVRPEDMEPGSMQTVFPFRDSDAGHEKLLRAAEMATDAPVMLFRLRPGTKVNKRPGQEDFNYGDYYAFSKVCTHLGCPASLYDEQTNISLCPCHWSQFLITDSARVVFGPATRPLPQLPIAVNDEGYFVARGDFIEPVGPAFWELGPNRP